MAPRTKNQSCLFQWEGHINKSHNPEKSVLGLSLNKDVGFKDIICYQQYIFNDQAYDNISGNKDWL
jgi:hypothetical protein